MTVRRRFLLKITERARNIVEFKGAMAADESIVCIVMYCTIHICILQYIYVFICTSIYDALPDREICLKVLDSGRRKVEYAINSSEQKTTRLEK